MIHHTSKVLFFIFTTSLKYYLFIIYNSFLFYLSLFLCVCFSSPSKNNKPTPLWPPLDTTHSMSPPSTPNNPRPQPTNTPQPTTTTKTINLLESTKTQNNRLIHHPQTHHKLIWKNHNQHDPNWNNHLPKWQSPPPTQCPILYLEKTTKRTKDHQPNSKSKTTDQNKKQPPPQPLIYTS